MDSQADSRSERSTYAKGIYYLLCMISIFHDNQGFICDFWSDHIAIDEGIDFTHYSRQNRSAISLHDISFQFLETCHSGSVRMMTSWCRSPFWSPIDSHRKQAVKQIVKLSVIWDQLILICRMRWPCNAVLVIRDEANKHQKHRVCSWRTNPAIRSLRWNIFRNMRLYSSGQNTPLTFIVSACHIC